MTSYLCDLALIGARVEQDVLITIDNGRFTQIEMGTAASGSATRLPGLSIPGLANAHSHAFHRALRSRTQADRGSFWTWRDLMYAAAEKLNPDSYLRLARATFAEMALAGVTAVGEFNYVHHQADGTRYDNPNAMGEALLLAAADAGIRITLLDTLYLQGGLVSNGYEAPHRVQSRFSDGAANTWAQRVNQLVAGRNQLIGAAVHSVRAVEPSAIKLVAEWADAHSAPLHAHVSEQPVENQQCMAFHNQTPTELLHDAGALSPRFSAVHATHLSDRDHQLLADSKSYVCLCPTTERDLADGIAATGTFRHNGVPMTLGSDSHAVIDMFEEARAVELNERLRSLQRGAHPALELLGMATLNSQGSLGWSDTGQIAVGKRADLVAISLDSVRMAGVDAGNAINAAVFAATNTDVSHVIVDGNLIVEDHRHLRIDVASELDASIRDLLDR